MIELRMNNNQFGYIVRGSFRKEDRQTTNEDTSNHHHVCTNHHHYYVIVIDALRLLTPTNANVCS
jgi:hypothetical protein